MTLIEDAHRIFDAALDEHDPTHVFLMTSGGNDSVVPLHLFHKHPRVTAAVHIDTGIKCPDVEPHVEYTCKLYGLPLLIYRASENTKADGTPDPQDFDQIVKEHGFPGPGQHSRMYIRLKQRQIERLVREHKVNFKDRIMLVTGVRKSESRRRMGYVEEIQRFGATVWTAPVANWDDEAMRLYRAHFKLPKNPASEKLGMSGECLCGAYAKPGEFDRLTEHYPEVAARLRNLERDAGCKWAWDGSPPRHLDIRVEDPDAPSMLCTSCISRGRVG